MKVLGILFVLMALTIGLVPQFTNCAVQGRAIQLPDGWAMPMKCHRTANATPVIAVPLPCEKIPGLVGRQHLEESSFLDCQGTP